MLKKRSHEYKQYAVYIQNSKGHWILAQARNLIFYAKNRKEALEKYKALKKTGNQWGRSRPWIKRKSARKTMLVELSCKTTHEILESKELDKGTIKY